MGLPDFSVRRSVTTIMVFVGVGIFGLVSINNLPQELFPPITYPQLTVITPYENAAPEEIETLITKPVEEAAGTVAGLRRVSSISKEGLSLVMAEFGWEQDMDFAALGVREKIDLIKERLPRDAEEPVVMKYNPFQLPILTLSVTGERHPASLRQLTRRMIKEELEKIDGVASCAVSGGLEREVLIEVDKGRLQAANLSIVEVARALREANLNFPAGTIKESFYEYLIRTLGEFEHVDEIGEIVVSLEPGSPASAAAEAERGKVPTEERRAILLKDVATVKDTFKERTSYSRYNGRENISVSVQKQAQANTIQVVDKVKKALKELKKDLPPDINVKIVYDQSEFIKSAIGGVRDAAVQGSFLAFLVLLFFLRNIKSSLIVVFSIPISIMVAFPFMFFSKLSLNMMSLGGLALGVGMLVDNAIVVIENIYRHRFEEKRPLKEAAVFGAEEMLNAISGSTLTTIAVFLPMVFVVGVAGQIFKQLSFTITFSLVASIWVALTLVPLLASRGREAEEWAKAVGKNPFFVKMEDLYTKVLENFLANKKKYLLITLVLFLISMVLVSTLEREFMPKVDQGQFIIKLNMPSGTKLDVTNRVGGKIEGCLAKIDEVEEVSAIVGSTKGAGAAEVVERLGSHQGEVSVNLKKKRKRSTIEVVQTMKDLLREVDVEGGATEFIIQQSILATAFREAAPVAIEIKGSDLGVLRNLTAEVQKGLGKIEGLYDIKNSLTQPSPETKVFVDKDKAAIYNLSVDDIARVSQMALAGYVATEYKEKGEEIDVRVRFREEDRATFGELERVLIHSPMGVNIPLIEVATFGRGKGPSQIDRLDQERIASVYANIYKRGLDKVVQDINKVLKKIKVAPGYTAKITGESEEMKESFNSLRFVLIFSVILVYMIMAAQFESLWQPFIIMFTVPLGLIGVAWALFMTHTSLNVVAILGIIMLGGIVVNNGIVLIDCVNILVHQGVDTRQALSRAAKTRLRPILMTSLTTILGLLPLALGIGAGAELQSPMAISVMGGLTISTFLTLLVIPALYLLTIELIPKLKRQK